MNKQTGRIALLISLFLFVGLLVHSSTQEKNVLEMAEAEVFAEGHYIDDTSLISIEATEHGEPNSIEDTTVVIGGKMHIELVIVHGKTENNMDLLNDAVEQIKNVQTLLPEELAKRFPGVKPGATIDITVKSVSINVDPSQVSENVWMAPATQQLNPGCTASYQVCIREVGKENMLAGGYQSAAVFFIVEQKPQFPVDGNPTSGYAYNSGYGVIAADNGYMQACRLGFDCVAVWHFLHELFHIYDAQHPEDGTSSNNASFKNEFGYYGTPKTPLVDVMGCITCQVVNDNTWRTVGAVNNAPVDAIFDIHNTSITFDVSVNGRVLTADVISQPNPSTSAFYQSINYQRLVACVRVGGGNCLRLTVLDSDAPREHFTVTLPVDWQAKVVTIEALSKYNGLVFAQSTYMVNMPNLAEKVYLPLIIK